MATVWRRMVGIVLVLTSTTAWGQTSPVITIQPRPQIVQTGQSATFSVTATGPETLSYQWRKDGVDLTNGGRISWAATGSSSTLTINNVTAEDVGSYDAVVASNTFEVTTSWPARLALAGSLYAAGDNKYGQLGIGGPQPGAALIGNVVKLAAGGSHTLALKNDGTVWAWGRNAHGQLGNGTATDHTLPVQVRGLNSVIAVQAGGSHSLAVKSDGTVWAWGYNGSGQLGDGTTTNQTSPIQVLALTDVVTVAAGGMHSLAVKSDGTVWAWGYNGSGQLGDGTTTNQTSPVQVPGLTGVAGVAAGNDHSLAVKSNGTIWAWGRNNYGQLGNGTTTRQTSPVQVPGLTDVAAFAAGGNHSLTVRSDGTVWVWGYNQYGQLGDGTAGYHNYRIDPIQVPGLMAVAAVAAGGGHSLAVKSDGTVWVCGDNTSGQLGNWTTTDQAVPIRISDLAGVVAVAAGGDWSGSYSLALKSNGTVWAWGNNAYGKLANGTWADSPSPIQIPGLSDVAGVAAGGGHNLAIKDDGTVWAWGNNWSGQLGDGTRTNQASPIEVPGLTSMVAVAAGFEHSLALRSDGTVWAWGSNTSGQLGDGTRTWHTSPVQVPGLTSVVAVAAGGAWAGVDDESYSLALKSDGTVWAWGNNAYGKLANGTWADSPSPIQIPGLSDVAGVAAGRYHILAVKSDGTVWAWGASFAGQLGNGTTTNQPSPIQVPGLTGVAAVAAGYYHSLAIKNDGTVWAWGANYHDQLGNGTTSACQTSPIQVPGLTGVAAVAGGTYHSLFVAQASTATPQLTGTWPANGTLERQVQSIVIGFNCPVLNVSPDDLTLSAGTAISVQGSGKGPYAFAVTDIPPGTTITATIGGDIATADGALLPPCQWTFRIAWPGDCNSDGYVNVGDLQLLVAAWSSAPTAANWNPAADLDHNNLVNVGDLWLLVANWAKSS